MASDATIAVAKSTGQGGDDFGAAAAILANLIANLISRCTTNSFIGIIQTIDEGGHDLGIADAVIPTAELAERGTALTGIASRLRRVDQLGNIARICIAALGFDRCGAARSGTRGSTAGRGT